MRKIVRILLILHLLVLESCAGPNPNPGERTVDTLWYRNKYDKAIDKIRPSAEQGLPWAQLRMGVAYQLGLGVKKDFDQALQWYKKVAIQEAKGKWADGVLIGAMGKPGYFNQNSDAMVAQYQIANIYLKSDEKHENIVKSYLWINYVSKASNAKQIFYCCEFSGGRWITQDMIQQTKTKVLLKMSEKQKQIADKTLHSWNPSID